MIDGHHRVTVLLELGCKFVPAYQVDYLKSDIEVKTWYPLVLGSKKRLFSLLRESGVSFYCSGCGENLIALNSGVFYLSKGGDEVMNALLGKIRLDYAFTREIAVDLALQGKISAALLFKPVSKAEVVERALKGKLFPPKTTQHIIPGKPRGVNVPIDVLR